MQYTVIPLFATEACTAVAWPTEVITISIYIYIFFYFKKHAAVAGLEQLDWFTTAQISCSNCVAFGYVMGFGAPPVVRFKCELSKWNRAPVALNDVWKYKHKNCNILCICDNANVSAQNQIWDS